MAAFTFNSPEGKSYTVQGPDGATPEQAFQILQQHLGTADAAPSTLEDAAKSVGAGLANATAGTFGALGDLRNLASSGIDAAGSELGVSPDKVQAFKDMIAKAAKLTPVTRTIADAPTSRDIINSAPDPIVSPDYQPQTTLGSYLKTGAEFAPALVDPEMAGPTALKTAGNVARRVVLPALASETAGQVTKGTAAEPYARAAAAFGTGALDGMLPALKGAPKAAVPTADELKAAARAWYNHPDVAAVQIKPQAVDDLATTIENDLVKQGFRPRAGQGGSVFDTINELRGAPGPVSVQDLDSVRKALGQVGKSGIPTPDSAAARAAIEHLDNFLPNLKQPDLLAGDAGAANQILQDARGNWAAAKRSDVLNDKIDAAELQAASANSGHNVENALRQKVRAILTSPRLSRGLSDDERSALEGFVRGNVTDNIIRHIGNVLGGGGGIGHLLSAGAGAVAAGTPGAIIGPMVGSALKAFGNATAGRRVRELDALLRSRSPEAARVAQQMAGQMPPQLLRLLPMTSAARLAALGAHPALMAPQQQMINQNGGQ
jgi:hypothetical protein